MEITSSSVKRYARSITANGLDRFRSIQSWRDWYESDMSPMILMLVKNDQIDAYRNNYELGFVCGLNNHSVDNGDIVFDPNMKYYTSETSNARSKYKFENGKMKYDPNECWYLVYRDLQTQVIQRFKKSSITTIDKKLRENDECPCCLEKLDGMLFNCENEHQVCYKCFDNLNYNSYTPRKCPVCRQAYKVLEVKRYEDAKGKKEIVLQEIHFTGSVVQREYKLVGLFKALISDSSHYNDMTQFILHGGLFHYVMETHRPLLDNKGNYSILTMDMLNSDSWNDFFTYIKTDHFKDIVYKGKSLSPPSTYDESTFLEHLSSKYGNDAIKVLTQASTDRCGNRKNKLKFQMYYEFVFLPATQDIIKEKFKNIISKVFVKTSQYRIYYDLIETEITE